MSERVSHNDWSRFRIADRNPSPLVDRKPKSQLQGPFSIFFIFFYFFWLFLPCFWKIEVFWIAIPAGFKHVSATVWALFSLRILRARFSHDPQWIHRVLIAFSSAQSLPHWLSLSCSITFGYTFQLSSLSWFQQALLYLCASKAKPAPPAKPLRE